MIEVNSMWFRKTKIMLAVKLLCQEYCICRSKLYLHNTVYWANTTTFQVYNKKGILYLFGFVNAKDNKYIIWKIFSKMVLMTNNC